jgi:SAM-dependent methyltransferase
MHSDRSFPLFSAADRRACEREEEFLLARLPLRMCRVLEVGPGAGRITRHLVRLSDELVICDNSVDNLARLRGLLPTFGAEGAQSRLHELEIGALSELPEYGTFDAAIAIRVLPLVDDWEQALWTLCDSVRPGGMVAFDLLSRRSWPGFVLRTLRSRRLPNRMLAPAQIEAAVNALPLESIETFHWGYPRWACFDADRWCARLFPGLAFGRLFVARRCRQARE